MKKSIVLMTLCFGFLVGGISQVDAMVKPVTTMKSLETLQRSPWDPREEQTSEDTGEEETSDRIQFQQ